MWRYVMASVGLLLIQPLGADDSQRLLRVDHYVRVRSTVPVISGQITPIYVREVCSSHNAAWERNHLLLFEASQEWLTTGSVTGQKEGTVKLGY
jgi:hypothetical protein